MPCAAHGQAINTQGQASAEKPSPASPELAEALRLSAKAVQLNSQGSYDEALRLAKQALDLREKALGPNHELIATSLNNIAGIYRGKHRYADAEALYRRSLKILENRFGVESRYLTDTIEHLAWMRFAQRNNGDAEKLFTRALAIREKEFGPEKLETAQTLSAIGEFCERINNLDKAADYFKRSLTIREKLLGPDHLDLLEALDDCACALIQGNHADDGKQYQVRANRIRNLTANDATNRQGAVLQGKALLRVEPEYPDDARRQGVQGTVIVEVTVDECGRVITAKALSGPNALRDASESAARRWRFAVTKLGLRRVKVIGTITFNFHR